MKEFIKDFNGFGPLYYKEELVFYDVPQLFTLYDNCKCLYLAMLINDNCDEYLIINISKDRLQDIKDSSLTLRDVFTHPEINKVYKVLNKDIQIVDPKTLQDTDLPDEGIYLNMLTDTQQSVQEDESWDSVRDSINIRLIHLENPDEHEMDCLTLARIVATIQNLITLQAKCKYGHLYSGPEISEMSRLNFSSYFIGSVGIKLKTRERQNFFNETKLTSILDSLSMLFEKNDIADLKEYFENNKYDYKVISTFKNYLNTLIKNNLDIEYSINLKEKSYKKYLTHSDISKQYNNLNSYIASKTFFENYEGLLVAVDTKTKTFKLEVDERIITGVIPQSLLKIQYNVNQRVTFRLEVKQEEQEVGKNLIEKFKLVDIISQ